jgi:hypothetical protein
VLNPDDVARAHVTAHAGEQCTTSADAGGDNLLSEALASSVSGNNPHDEALI